MKEILQVVGLTILVLTILGTGVYFLVGKLNVHAEAACTQKGGHLVRTYSTTVCAKVEVIK